MTEAWKIKSIQEKRINKHVFEPQQRALTPQVLPGSSAWQAAGLASESKK